MLSVGSHCDIKCIWRVDISIHFVIAMGVKLNYGKFYGTLKPYLKVACINGLPLVLSKSNRERCLWATVVLIGLIVSVYHCSLIFPTTLTQKTLTKIDRIDLSDVSYPTITICDYSGQYFLKWSNVIGYNISGAQVLKRLNKLEPESIKLLFKTKKSPQE